MRSVSKVSILFLALWLIVPLSGCGRYVAPLPPEAFSPRAVQRVQASPLLEGIKLSWDAPLLDARGKELQNMGGYRLYRKTLVNRGSDEQPDFELITTIVDKSIAQLNMDRDRAVEQNKPRHRIKVRSELTHFEYTDVTLEAGERYIYKIVPYNQNEVEGQVNQIVQVLFRGDSSEIKILEDLNL